MGEFSSSLGSGLGGGRYSVSTPKGYFDGFSGHSGLTSTPIEKITRTGLPEDVLKRLAAKRPPVEDDREADFRFGKPARFDADTAPTGPSVVIRHPEDEKPEEPEPDAIIREYDFVSRTVEVIRIENPSDPQQYVMNEQDRSVLFRQRETGEYIRLNIRYD